MQPAAPYGYAPQPYGYAPSGYAPQAYPQAELAGFWVRVIAYIIDRVILSVVGFAFGFVLGLVAVLANPQAYQGGSASSSPTDSPAFTLLLYAVLLLIEMAYFAGQWTFNGATFGQRVLGLRVVDADSGQPIGPGTALLRWVGMLISFLVCYLGVIWVAFDSRKQGWHDKMAGTLVIRA